MNWAGVEEAITDTAVTGMSNALSRTEQRY